MNAASDHIILLQFFFNSLKPEENFVHCVVKIFNENPKFWFLFSCFLTAGYKYLYKLHGMYI